MDSNCELHLATTRPILVDLTMEAEDVVQEIVDLTGDEDAPLSPLQLRQSNWSPRSPSPMVDTRQESPDYAFNSDVMAAETDVASDDEPMELCMDGHFCIREAIFRMPPMPLDCKLRLLYGLIDDEIERMFMVHLGQ